MSPETSRALELLTRYENEEPSPELGRELEEAGARVARAAETLDQESPEAAALEALAGALTGAAGDVAANLSRGDQVREAAAAQVREAAVRRSLASSDRAEVGVTRRKATAAARVAQKEADDRAAEEARTRADRVSHTTEERLAKGRETYQAHVAEAERDSAERNRFRAAIEAGTSIREASTLVTPEPVHRAVALVMAEMQRDGLGDHAGAVALRRYAGGEVSTPLGQDLESIRKGLPASSTPTEMEWKLEALRGALRAAELDVKARLTEHNGGHRFAAAAMGEGLSSANYALRALEVTQREAAGAAPAERRLVADMSGNTAKSEAREHRRALREEEATMARPAGQEIVNSVAALRRIPIGTRLRMVENRSGACDSMRTVQEVKSKDIGLLIDDPSSKGHGQVSWINLAGLSVEARDNGFALLLGDKLMAAYQFANAAASGEVETEPDMTTALAFAPKGGDRAVQLVSAIQYLEKTGRGKGGKIRPAFQKQIDAANAELASLVRGNSGSTATRETKSIQTPSERAPENIHDHRDQLLRRARKNLETSDFAHVDELDASFRLVPGEGGTVPEITIDGHRTLGSDPLPLAEALQAVIGLIDNSIRASDTVSDWKHDIRKLVAASVKKKPLPAAEPQTTEQRATAFLREAWKKATTKSVSRWQAFPIAIEAVAHAAGITYPVAELLVSAIDGWGDALILAETKAASARVTADHSYNVSLRGLVNAMDMHVGVFREKDVLRGWEPGTPVAAHELDPKVHSEAARKLWERQTEHARKAAGADRPGPKQDAWYQLVAPQILPNGTLEIEAKIVAIRKTLDARRAAGEEALARLKEASDRYAQKHAVWRALHAAGEIPFETRSEERAQGGQEAIMRLARKVQESLEQLVPLVRRAAALDASAIAREALEHSEILAPLTRLSSAATPQLEKRGKNNWLPPLASPLPKGQGRIQVNGGLGSVQIVKTIWHGDGFFIHDAGSRQNPAFKITHEGTGLAAARDFTTKEEAIFRAQWMAGEGRGLFEVMLDGDKPEIRAFSNAVEQNRRDYHAQLGKKALAQVDATTEMLGSLPTKIARILGDAHEPLELEELESQLKAALKPTGVKLTRGLLLETLGTMIPAYVTRGRDGRYRTQGAEEPVDPAYARAQRQVADSTAAAQAVEKKAQEKPSLAHLDSAIRSWRDVVATIAAAPLAEHATAAAQDRAERHDVTRQIQKRILEIEGARARFVQGEAAAKKKADNQREDDARRAALTREVLANRRGWQILTATTNSRGGLYLDGINHEETKKTQFRWEMSELRDPRYNFAATTFGPGARAVFDRMVAASPEKPCGLP